MLLVVAILTWLGGSSFNLELLIGLAVVIPLVGLPGPVWHQKRRLEQSLRDPDTQRCSLARPVINGSRSSPARPGGLVERNVRTKFTQITRPFVWMASVAASSGETAQLPVHRGLAPTRPIATLIMGRRLPSGSSTSSHRRS